MPLDPEVQQLLDQMNAAQAPPMETCTPEEARQQMDAASVLLGEGPELAEVVTMHVAGPGGELPIRVYRPTKQEGRPAIVYFHGGGWVLGSIQTHDAYCRQLALESNMVIFSVDYRLAPEHVFPAAAEDAYAAVQWVAQHAAEFGGNPQRLAVAGDSAGGNLAAVAALMVRDRGGPRLSFQLLIYPITDSRLDRRSYAAFGEGYHLTRAAMQWFWEMYVPQAADRTKPYAAPFRAFDPACIVTAEYDPLCEEGAAFAKRLQASGVRTELLPYDGMIHGFVRRTRFLARARTCLTDLAQRLRAALD